MSDTFVEILSESRSISAGRTNMEQQIVVQFKIDEDAIPSFGKAEFLGADDDVVALEFAYSILPDGRWLPGSEGNEVFLIITDLKLEQVNNYGWWKATANYVYDLNTGQGGGNGRGTSPGEATLPYIKIGFNVGGRTKTITQSLEVINRVPIIGPLNRPEPDNDLIGNTIGYSEDGIAGAEIYGSGLALQITAYYFPEYVTFTFLNLLAEMIPSVNADQFLAYQPGEVLLYGADGSATVNDVVPITFSVEIKRNIKDQPDPPFTDLTCDGHTFIDYQYLKGFDDKAKVLLQLPSYRTLHKVYRDKPFAALGFPTT